MKSLILKILVGLAACGFAILVPFVFLDAGKCISAVRYWGYWGISACFLLFLYFLIQEKLFSKFKRWVFQNRWVVVLSIAITLFFHAHERMELKILFDEFAINLTAKEMFLNHEAYAVSGAHRFHDFLFGVYGMVDKRPIFFPYVVSLLHTFTGYRMENVFILNSLLTIGFLLLVFEFTRKLTSRSYGVFSVLMFSTLPLLAQNTNGGGFEIMNLVMILLLMLTTVSYLESEGTKGLNFMIITAVLLANTRYESILYLAVPLATVLLKAWRNRKLELTWFSVISPVLIMLPLLSNRVFTSNDGFMDNQRDTFFGSQYIARNFAAAVGYLFEFDGTYNNSLLISILGIVAIVFVLVLAIRLLPQSIRHDSVIPVFYLVFGISFGILGILSFYHWAQWTDPLTSRFSLPLQLMMVLSISVVLFHGFEIKELPKKIWSVPVLFLVVFSGMAFGKTVERTEIFATGGYRWMTEYAEKHLDNLRSLFVVPSPGLFLLKDFAAIPTENLNMAPEKVLMMKEIKMYDEIFVGQHVRIDGFSHTTQDKSFIKLNPRLLLEPIAEYRVRINYAYRISRIVGIRPAEEGEEQTVDINLPPEKPSEPMMDKEYWDYVSKLCAVNVILRPGDLPDSEKYRTFKEKYLNK